MSKKKIREAFRTACMRRDHFRCVLCPVNVPNEELEVYHITNRNDMPLGGYIPANGITLCPKHHLQVEKENSPLVQRLLYILINSDYKRAVAASERSK